MIRYFGRAACGAMALMAAQPALAQGDPAAAQPAAATGCELHIWPAERFAAENSGLLGGLAGALMNSGKNADNKTQMASALDSAGQVDALESLELISLLKLSPGTVIVKHEEPLERKTMNKVKTRRADSASTCYSELIVADFFYQKSMMYGRSLRTLFMFRNFGPGQTIKLEYKNWGGNGLKLFPAKEGEDVQAANEEVVSVFKANFLEYARNAASYMARPKKI